VNVAFVEWLKTFAARKNAAPAPIAAQLLRDILASVPSEDFVDKGLISDASPARFLAELLKDAGIDSDRDQLARLVAERRSADAPHRLQLLRG
jgi:hypothetical protein